MSHEPLCPDCSTPVQPTWDWCMACGYDPDHLMPTGWTPGLASVGAVHRLAPVSSSVPTAVPTPGPRPTTPRPVAGLLTSPGVADARPQEITDPDWVTLAPAKRMSYLGVIGLVAAIVIAIGSVILVTVLVLNRPIGTTQANAMGLAPTAVVSGPVAAAAG